MMLTIIIVKSLHNIVGQSIAAVIFLYFAAVLVIILALVHMVLEAVQLHNRRKNYQYLKEFENYIQLLAYISSIIFVLPTGHECWCFPSWKWQIGVVAVFLAWLNGIIFFKDLPFIGEPVTMLLHIYRDFLKLIYLPILLILTFGFPAYMLFTRNSIKVRVYTVFVRIEALRLVNIVVVLNTKIYNYVTVALVGKELYLVSIQL